ncbi:MAG TPA: CDP-alcohol phosphatidyltransferase family protein, partial [Vampirovibrionales bacterium]
MFDDSFRKVLPKYVSPIVQILIKWKVTPNQITVTGFVLSIIAALLISFNFFIWGLTFWWLSRLSDGLDGIVARESGQKSLFGGYLDILLDMAAYSLMIIAFAYVYKEQALTWNFILLGYVLCITSVLALSSILESLRSSNELKDLKL